MNHSLTSLLAIVLTTLAFSTRSHAATMGDNKAPVAIPIVESYPSNDAITLRWLKASDDNTPQEKLQYTVQWIKSNGTGAGSEVCTDIDCYTIKGLTPNARYSVQVSVSDESGLTFSYGTMTIVTVAGAYDLAVGDVQVTTSNQNDVLGDGTVSFSNEDGKAILTLNSAKINAAHYGIRAGKFDNGLTINCKNASSITSDQEAIWVNGDCEFIGNIATFTGNAVGRAGNKFSGNLTISHMSDGALRFYSNKGDALDMGGNTLSILSSTMSARTYASNSVAIVNCGKCVTRGIKEYTIKEYNWSYDQNQRKFYKNEVEATSISTESNSNTSFGIKIGGVEVTYRNFYDVLGDRRGNWPEGTVSVRYLEKYDEIEIYLRNAHIENLGDGQAMEIFTHKKVTIFLEGENTINSSAIGIWAWSDLYIKGPGSLIVNAKDYALWNTKYNIYLEDHCSVDLYSNLFPLAVNNDNITTLFNITESSLTLRKGASISDNTPVLNSCPKFTFWGSYIASDHTYQYKDGKTNFYDSNGQIATNGPIIIKIGSGPEPTNKFDINGDGSVNATDVVCIYNHITIGESSGVTKSKADLNGDGNVNTTDVVALYNYIINGE